MDKFKFDITQTSKVMLYKVKVNAGKKWNISGNVEDKNFRLVAIKDNEKYIEVVINDGGMTLTTVRGYHYKICDKPKDGATVVFEGPINALLVQALLPKMTYVPQTLTAMADGETEWSDIETFGEIRKKRNPDKENPQDRHGYKVNAKVNNEIPFFPPSRAIKVAEPEAKKEKRGKFKR